MSIPNTTFSKVNSVDMARKQNEMITSMGLKSGGKNPGFSGTDKVMFQKGIGVTSEKMGREGIGKHKK